MNAIFSEFARQIILVIFYVLVMIVAVRLGIMFAKNKNAKKTTSNNDSSK